MAVIEMLDRLISSQKGLLGSIFSVCWVAQHAVTKIEHRSLVNLYQFSESFRIAFLSQGEGFRIDLLHGKSL